MIGWQGHYQDEDGERSSIMEVVATNDLWSWHADIGLSSVLTHNNVANRPPLMVNLLKGQAPHAKCNVNGQNYNMCYVLGYGISLDRLCSRQ